MLCYGGVQAYDRGRSELGFGPSVASCSGNKCTITRNTSDGALRLKQVITKNSSEERSINVEMTVTNLRSSVIGSVILRRMADFDVDAYGAGTGDFVNRFGASQFDSVYSWNAADDHPGIDSAILLRHLKRTPPTIQYLSKVTDYFADVSCNPVNIAARGSVQGDHAATIQYNIGNLGAGRSAVAKVQIQRN